MFKIILCHIVYGINTGFATNIIVKEIEISLHEGSFLVLNLISLIILLVILAWSSLHQLQ